MNCFLQINSGKQVAQVLRDIPGSLALRACDGSVSMPASVAEGEDEMGRCCVQRAGHQRRGGVPVRERADGLLGIVIGLFFQKASKLESSSPKLREAGSQQASLLWLQGKC